MAVLLHLHLHSYSLLDIQSDQGDTSDLPPHKGWKGTFNFRTLRAITSSVVHWIPNTTKKLNYVYSGDPRRVRKFQVSKRTRSDHQCELYLLTGFQICHVVKSLRSFCCYALRGYNSLQSRSTRPIRFTSSARLRARWVRP